MTTPASILFAAAALCAGLFLPNRSPESQPSVAAPATVQDPQGQDDMKAMMAKAAKLTKPGENHKVLERFVGKWKTETRGFMGEKSTPASPGEAEFTWLMPGRWLQQRTKTSMMGMPFEIYSMMGYDNFKQSFVFTQVTSMDTAMNHAEGDMDPSGKTLLMYGTIDEYLTGEHDKMVRYVWRFPSADEMVLEVHDLPIGENNTKVVEAKFTRIK